MVESFPAETVEAREKILQAKKVRFEEAVEKAWLRVGYVLSIFAIVPWIVWGHYMVVEASL